MSDSIEEKTPKKVRWTSEKVMSISALFVSAVSLFALFYQLNLAREENQLIRKQQSASVLPHLSQWYSNAGNGFKVVFGNKGVGPAFIKKVTMSIQDTVFHNSDHLVSYVLRDIFKTDSISISATTSTFSEGYVLPASEVVEFLVIEDDKNGELVKSRLKSLQFGYEIIYQDVYGSQWKLNNKTPQAYPAPKK